MNAPKNTMDLMKEILNHAFSPNQLTISDDSYLHRGHAGDEQGKGHYSLDIQSDVFFEKTQIMRHKMIYAALGTLMETHIHALKITVK